MPSFKSDTCHVSLHSSHMVPAFTGTGKLGGLHGYSMRSKRLCHRTPSPNIRFYKEAHMKGKSSTGSLRTTNAFNCTSLSYGISLVGFINNWISVISLKSLITRK